MQVTFQLTQRDFYDALLASRNRRLFSKWAPRLLVCFAALMLAVSLTSYFAAHDPKTLTNIFTGLALIVFWVAIFWGWPWWFARKQFTRYPSAQGERTVTFDDSGVHWHWGAGNGYVDWSHYIGYWESKDHLLLYTSPVLFGILPKRSLSSDQLVDLRSVLANHLRAIKK